MAYNIKTTISELENLFDLYANRSMEPQWHRSSTKGCTRDPDKYAVGRFIDYLIFQGGGHDERGIFFKLIEGIILNRVIENQDGEYVYDEKGQSIRFVPFEKDNN